jgi:AraC-like DNA-binding protein
MEGRQNICLIISDKTIWDNVNFYIQKQFDVFNIKEIRNILPIARIHIIHGIIFYVKENLHQQDKGLIYFRNHFPTIPLIGIIAENNIEVARKCGEIGFNRLYMKNQIEQLINEMADLINSLSLRITVSELPIEFEKCSELAKKILTYIEHNYIQIINIQQLTNYLDISESILNTELKANNIPTAKKIILFFKIKHSILLMQNKGLNLTEISRLSGFTNNKRFGECFIRAYGMTPKTFRIKQENY